MFPYLVVIRDSRLPRSYVLRICPSRDGVKCNRNNGCHKEEHHKNRKPKGDIVEMTTCDRPILLCVTYTLAFGIATLGKIGYEMIRYTCLVRPKLSNIHGSLQASALNQPLNGEGAALGISSLQVS
jgi:hypothetical protein